MLLGIGATGYGLSLRFYLLAQLGKGAWGAVMLPAFDWGFVQIAAPTAVDGGLLMVIAFENLSAKRDLPDGKPLVIRYASSPDARSRSFEEMWKRDLDALGGLLGEVSGWYNVLVALAHTASGGAPNWIAVRIM